MSQPQYPSYPGPDESAGKPPGQPPYGQQPPPVYGQPVYGQPVYGQPAHGQQVPPGYGPPAYAPLPVPSNGKAMWAMITGIVSVVFCYVGLLIGPTAIVLAILARNEIRRSHPPQSGDGMAIAGLVTGIAGTVIWAAVIALVVVSMVVE